VPRPAVVSTVEDVSALTPSLVAVLLPLLVLVLLAAVAVLLFFLYRGLRRRRRPGTAPGRPGAAGTAQKPR
jgi:hypothetical protein